MTDEKTRALITDLREYATALRASVHVHHTGADLIEHAADTISALTASDGDDYIDFVLDGPPEHLAGRFVEVEDSSGASIKLGKWTLREDGYWALRVSTSMVQQVPGGGVRERLVESVAGGTISIPGGYAELARDDAENIVDTILGDPALSRDIAGEIEDPDGIEADLKALYPWTGRSIPNMRVQEERLAFKAGLRRAAEIVRSGR